MNSNEKKEFIGTESTYEEREKRFNDVVNLIKPDRVPIASFAALFFTKYSGLTHAEALYDYDKMSKAWKQSIKKLNWDMAPLQGNIFPGKVMEMIGLKTFKWPGYNLGDMLSYQYVENEYMTADDYDEFLRDPGSFLISKVLPRMATVFEPLSMIPPIPGIIHGYSVFIQLPTFAGIPIFKNMMETLIHAGEEMNRYNAAQGQLVADLAEMGYPCISGGVTFPAFDWLCVMLRGLKGTMLDMFRQPDKLKAALNLLLPFSIGQALAMSQLSGNKRIFIPIWRGSANFLSDKQFVEFYWPTFKQLIEALVSNGLTPMPWFQGNYTPRLKYLAEFPPGKVAGHFDIIDRSEAKQALKDVMCYWGDVPPDLLVTGKPDQVRDYVKELIDYFSDTGGLIVDGTVEGMPSESKPENVEALTETVFKYGVY